MKKLLLALLFLPLCSINAQDQDLNAKRNTAMAMTPASGASNNFNNGSGSKFYNLPMDTSGSYYVFKKWENNSIIYATDKKRYKIRNMNINIKDNSFQSKISKDSVFTFDPYNIHKIVIEGREFKNLTLNNQSKIYEVIFESEDFSILKAFKSIYVKGSVSPMSNRSKNKYMVRSKYYLKKGNNTSKFKLKKKNLLKLFKNKEGKNKFKAYMKSNNLSYKDDADVRKALKAALN